MGYKHLALFSYLYFSTTNHVKSEESRRAWKFLHYCLWGEYTRKKDGSLEGSDDIQTSNLSWPVAGYFNIARFTSEIVSGKSLFFSIEPLQWLLVCSLSDLRSIRGIWSWNNKNLDTRRIAGRLDRCLCNTEWLDTLPASYCEYLPHSTCDHSLMIVQLLASQQLKLMISDSSFNLCTVN